jgi:hypothetical protein
MMSGRNSDAVFVNQTSSGYITVRLTGFYIEFNRSWSIASSLSNN